VLEHVACKGSGKLHRVVSRSQYRETAMFSLVRIELQN
jgi:hypothetical protein